MIFCTRKIVKDKFFTHREISFRTLRNYSIEVYKENLRRINFPNYENFYSVDEAYNDLVSKITNVLDIVAPIKKVRVKNRSTEWFDAEILEKINIRDKLFKKYKSNRLTVYEQLYREAKNSALSLIRKKKSNFLNINFVKM